jgi:hypothetical protein
MIASDHHSSFSISLRHSVIETNISPLEFLATVLRKRTENPGMRLVMRYVLLRKGQMEIKLSGSSISWHKVGLSIQVFQSALLWGEILRRRTITRLPATTVWKIQEYDRHYLVSQSFGKKNQVISVWSANSKTWIIPHTFDIRQGSVMLCQSDEISLQLYSHNF